MFDRKLIYSASFFLNFILAVHISFYWCFCHFHYNFYWYIVVFCNLLYSFVYSFLFDPCLTTKFWNCCFSIPNWLSLVCFLLGYTFLALIWNHCYSNNWWFIVLFKKLSTMVIDLSCLTLVWISILVFTVSSTSHFACCISWHSWYGSYKTL